MHNAHSTDNLHPMYVLVSQANNAGASGWEIATAIGTIAGALATAAAVIAALVIGAKDRRAAEAAAQDQAKLADKRQRRDHRAAQRARYSERQIDLLLRLDRQLSTYLTEGNLSMKHRAAMTAQSVLLALGSVEELAAARYLIGQNISWPSNFETVQTKHPDADLTDGNVARIAQVEISNAIKDQAANG